MTSEIKTLSMLIVVIIIFAANSTMAVTFTDAEKQKLSSGKTIKRPLPNSGKNGFYGGTGYTLINAPSDVVWNAIQDWGSYHKIFPKTISVIEISRKRNKSLLKMKMGHKLISLEYFMSIDRNPEKKIMSFRLVKNKPHDIESSRGYWRLFPQKTGKTLIAYVVAAQVPMGIINLIRPNLERKIERNLIGAPNDIKKWITGKNGKKYFSKKE